MRLPRDRNRRFRIQVEGVTGRILDHLQIGQSMPKEEGGDTRHMLLPSRISTGREMGDLLREWVGLSRHHFHPTTPAPILEVRPRLLLLLLDSIQAVLDMDSPRARLSLRNSRST